MLSYRHGFHAGNFADVLKHVVLTHLLLDLTRKPAPLCYLETHAGAGRYDLASDQAQKTGEFRDGIGRLWLAGGLPPGLAPYLEAVRALNPDGALRVYPGSPRIARHWLRPGDRMVLAELHGSDYPLLKAQFAGDRQVAVHHMDGYQGLKAFLPPQEKRGLLLLDPAYEVKDEYDRLPAALRAAYPHWRNGVYAVWYPILTRVGADRFLAALAATGIRKMLLAELTVRPAAATAGMGGCGMVVVNPPWRLEETLAPLLAWLAEALAGPTAGAWRVEWLVAE